VNPCAGHVDGRDWPIERASAPAVGRREAADAISARYSDTVEPCVHRAIRAACARATQPDLIGAGGREFDREIQLRAAGNVAGIQIGTVVRVARHALPARCRSVAGEIPGVGGAWCVDREVLGFHHHLSAKLQERAERAATVVGMCTGARRTYVAGARAPVVRAGVRIVRVLATEPGAAAVVRANVAIVTTDRAVLAAQRGVTAVRRASVGIIAIQSSAALATEREVAYFCAIADLSVIASGVACLMRTSLGYLVAGVLRASHAVATRDGCARAAAAGQALLRAVTERAVVALGVARAGTGKASNFDVVDHETGEVVGRPVDAVERESHT